ncbi:MAG: YicC/YloC family endoribonuclease [Oscillospiraceae bacterium]
MVKSMTGYGRGEATQNGRKITVEVRSVNNRYLDCGVKLPRAYIFAEDAIKTRVAKAISRGKVDVFVNIVQTEGESLSVTVNEELAKSYIAALRQLYELGGGMLKGNCYATDLARFPDVLTVEKKEEDLEAVAADICAVLDLALEDFDRMRTREGEKLAADILGRADTIEAYTARVEERSPQTVAEYRARLESKMQEVLANVQLDESRILTEAAIFADKVAVDEETVRLRSHLEQLRGMLSQGGATGRKLDFLIQEFNRETNTIGSKCNDIDISRMVVDMKAEIEKIREQVQNIE